MNKMIIKFTTVLLILLSGQILISSPIVNNRLVALQSINENLRTNRSISKTALNFAKDDIVNQMDLVYQFFDDKVLNKKPDIIYSLNEICKSWLKTLIYRCTRFTVQPN